MTVENNDFSLRRGKSKDLQFTITDDGTATGTAKDLTGATITWSMAKTVNNTALLTKTSASASEVSITSPSSGGICVVHIDPADTINATTFPASEDGVDYYHETVVVDSAGDETTISTGTITFKESLID